MKQAIKETLGAAISSVMRQRTETLTNSPTNNPSNVCDKAIMAWLKRRALNNGSSDFFERLHQDFWSSEGGSVFSSNCDHRFEDLFLKRQQEDFVALEKVWNEFKPANIAEFGCSSGLLLNYLATHLDGLDSATGIDINPDQIKANQQSDAFDPRIVFQCGDAGKWLGEEAKENTLFVTNGGVLEYFTRERLNAMLTEISSNLKPAIFFASEPVATDHDWSESTESVPFGEELSFSHNYTDLFESNGFEVIHSRAVDYDKWKMVATIAIAR